ncbi:inactive serine protease 54 isoform X1 [Gorilla gorilla gorilla]|uniref:inactive serine protease 54 isoform X1 n=1 Tax=Gorilla gorilla gorilla TaxID=9595 RepID=UPI00300B5D2F
MSLTAFYGYRVKARVEFHEPKSSPFQRPNSLGCSGAWAGLRRKLTRVSCPLFSGHLTNHSAGQLVLPLYYTEPSTRDETAAHGVHGGSFRGWQDARGAPGAARPSLLFHQKNIVVIVGISNMDPSKIAHTEYPVNTIIIHEDFDNNSMSNNIALLKTDTAMHFGNLVQSICFLSRMLHTPPVLQNCWVSGWNPTSATGNHMTMSVLRKIFVKDLDMCPLYKLQKTECGSHTKEETQTACLGDPGSPMMCQLQQFDLWVLRGVLNFGGETCPGLFLYTKVEDYSKWITSKAERAGPPLSSLHHWEKLISFSHHGPNAAMTQKTYSDSELGHVGSYLQGQRRTITHSRLGNSSRDSLDVREKDVKESGRSPEASVQPLYYDYYGGEVGEGRIFAGQNRLHQPEEIILVSFVLVFSLQQYLV